MSLFYGLVKGRSHRYQSMSRRVGDLTIDQKVLISAQADEYVSMSQKNTLLQYGKCSKAYLCPWLDETYFGDIFFFSRSLSP